MCVLGYSSLHKGYKCLHVPSNHVYISRDVVFDENLYPFSNFSASQNPSNSSSLSLPSSNQFVDAAYSPLLLPNHGADTGRGAQLEHWMIQKLWKLLMPIACRQYRTLRRIAYMPSQALHQALDACTCMRLTSTACSPMHRLLESIRIKPSCA